MLLQVVLVRLSYEAGILEFSLFYGFEIKL